MGHNNQVETYVSWGFGILQSTELPIVLFNPSLFNPSFNNCNWRHSLIFSSVVFCPIHKLELFCVGHSFIQSKYDNRLPVGLYVNPRGINPFSTTICIFMLYCGIITVIPAQLTCNDACVYNG